MFDKEKIALAVKVMQENHIDTWITAGHESATNAEPILPIISDHEFIGYTALIFNSDGTSKCICTPIDQNGYIHANVFDDVEAFPISFEATLAAYLKTKQPSVIALNYSEEDPSSDGLSYGCYQYIEEAIKDSGIQCDIVSASKIIRKIKGIKSERELQLMKEACKITQEIFDGAKAVIKAGVNCQEIFAYFQSEVEKRGLEYSWPASSNPGVFSGYDCPRGHMGAPDVLVKKGDLVNVDFGIRYQGYSSDMQRMYYILKEGETKAPATAQKAFDTVRDAIALSAKLLTPGKTGYEIDQAARDYVMAQGYPSWSSALGHSIGAYAHDGGQTLGPERAGMDRTEAIHTPIAIGSCFTLEPSVLCEQGMVGIEENVVVTATGCEFLSVPQTELYLIR